MNDTVKLIIEIPKDIYERCKDYKLWSYDAETLEGAVARSTPLDDVKAEIISKHSSIVEKNDFDNGRTYGYEECLSILDNIGKADMRGDRND